MIIVDNKIQVAKIRLAYIVLLAVGVFILFSPFIFNFSEAENLISHVFGVLALLAFIYLVVIKPHYIYFSVEGNSKIVIRTYHAFPLFRKYKAYQLNIKDFDSYEIRTMLFNQIKRLRLYIISKNKTGKYPWLELSVVPEKDYKMLINFLDKILPPERRKKS
ncbi:MAG: hypothetical protein U0W24_19465 [Bacteroidales bacterium]